MNDSVEYDESGFPLLVGFDDELPPKPDHPPEPCATIPPNEG